MFLCTMEISTVKIMATTSMLIDLSCALSAEKSLLLLRNPLKKCVTE